MSQTITVRVSTSTTVPCCKITGYFTLYNGRVPSVNQSPAESAPPTSTSDLILYDTKIIAASGMTRCIDASIYISGFRTFPDGSVVSAEAEGGPVPFTRQGLEEFRYKLYTTRVLYLVLDPAACNHVKNFYNRIQAAGRITSSIRRTCYGDLAFDLETTKRVKERTRKWVILCIVPQSSLKFMPTKDTFVTVSGLIYFMSEYDWRRFDVRVDDMGLIPPKVEE